MKTFGDSTKTPGQHIDDRCYILAQLPETAKLEWARELRSLLGGGELKYAKYLGLRHRVQANKKLWTHVLEGTAEATIVVIENRFYIDAIAYRLKSDGAEFGHDFNFDDILRQAALCMIEHSPVMRLADLADDTMIADTLRFVQSPRRAYTPEAVFHQIGEKFSDAAVFAARAHASFDIEELNRAASTNELFLSPHRRRLMTGLGSTERVFDNEHPKSAAMLNELFDSCETRPSNAQAHHVSESNSESNDWLQAADFCAGFASERMMNATDDRERELRQHFRKVIFNGAAR